MAKIHTTEWTPAILGHPVLQAGMAAIWWGVAGETITKRFGRITGSEVVSGIRKFCIVDLSQANLSVLFRMIWLSESDPSQNNMESCAGLQTTITQPHG